MTTNCVRCGERLKPGQEQCSCGQYVDLPDSEFYTRLEARVEKSSRDNFRRGLLLGLGFLALFLVLETVMDTSYRLQTLFIATVTLIAAVALIFNLWQLVRKLLSKRNGSGAT